MPWSSGTRAIRRSPRRWTTRSGPPCSPRTPRGSSPGESADQFAEPLGVADGVPVSVVVEVDEDVAAGARPLPHPVGPPAQIAIAVRTGVEVARVRAVHPHVDEPRGHPQDAGQL